MILPPQEFRTIFEESGFSPSNLQLFREFRFEIIEGMEDPEILNCQKIDENKLYIDYSYNLRLCTIICILSASDYYANKNQLEKEFYNAEIDEKNEEATIYAFTRCYYYANFIFNIAE